MKKFLITLLLLVAITIPVGEMRLVKEYNLAIKSNVHIGYNGMLTYDTFSISKYPDTNHDINLFFSRSSNFKYKGITFKVISVTPEALTVEIIEENK